MTETLDLLIVGGGINGAGVARDAAGRGLSVVLCEQGDLGAATSSASTKLFHGGLRYLEHYAFSLVRKALAEREVLLAMTPHIARPMRFVLPQVPGMRPAWLLRLGLFLYDHIGGRRRLPGTRMLDLRHDPAGAPLKPGFRRAFEYSDGWVDDARLVVLNARDAADRGARILTRTRLEGARREGRAWRAALRDLRNGRRLEIRARVLVNAAGPWVDRVDGTLGVARPDPIRLVRGSHVVLPGLFDHDRAYLFQNGDGRVIFAIPYEEDFTCIGTTDVDHAGDPSEARCSDAEAAYLCAAASEYFARPVRPEDVVWSYSGVRPLDDDSQVAAAKASRDYHIRAETPAGGAPLFSIYGGKITTYRKLAEELVTGLAPHLPLDAGAWTATAPLPGGDFEIGARPEMERRLQRDYPFLPAATARRLIRCYGTLAWKLLGTATGAEDLGEDFGAGLSAAEVAWLCDTEWAETAEDILWRRTKCGLHMDAGQRARLETWLRERLKENAT